MSDLYNIGVICGNQKAFDAYADKRREEMGGGLTGRTHRQWRFNTKTNAVCVFLIDEYTLPFGWRLDELVQLPILHPQSRIYKRIDDWKTHLRPSGTFTVLDSHSWTAEKWGG